MNNSISKISAVLLVIVLTLLISTQDFVHYLLHEHHKIVEHAEYNDHSETNCLICGNHTSPFVIEDFNLLQDHLIVIDQLILNEADSYSGCWRLLNYGRAPPLNI